MRHESDGDDNNSQWGKMMNNCLNGDDIRPHLADYKRDITVGELRGKVLVLSRDNYASKPVGGLISGWGHQANYVTGSIKGPAGVAGTLYVQDFYEVLEKMTAKLNGIEKLLNFSTTNNVYKNARHLLVCINCTSGYTASASSDGNRDNAAHCNKKVIDYLADETHAGPTGIILMDFAGVNTSESYEVRGLELVNAVINNNQCYVPVKKGDATGVAPLSSSHCTTAPRYDLLGRRLTGQPHRSPVIIERARKVVSK